MKPGSDRSFSRAEIGKPDRITLSPEEDATFLDAEATADRDAEEVRVTMRLKRGQLALIRRVAQRFSLPHQTYIKPAGTRPAIADMEEPVPLPHAGQSSPTAWTPGRVCRRWCFRCRG